MYKTIGILGGMGPAATVDLMDKIIKMTDAECDQEHIPMLIYNDTRIPDRTEAILCGGENPVPEMLAGAKRLEQAGADFLIVPCNTAHYFIPEMEQSISIPILNMPMETAGSLVKKGIHCAAVLATDGTCKTGLYDRVLDSYGIKTIYPESGQQELIMSLIYDYIKKGITDPEVLPREEIRKITEDLQDRGAEALVLACTELPVAFEIMDLYDEHCTDPTQILAAAAISEAGARLKPEYETLKR